MAKAICNNCFKTGKFEVREDVPFPHCTSPHKTICDACESRVSGIHLVK